jgi:diguanylate cyclase
MLHHHHHPAFVILSVVVAVFGSWTALDLVRRVQTHVGVGRTAWVVAAAVAMGLSIWSMHFVAMLGFDPGSAISYDPLLTLASLLLAIGATLGAFVIVAQQKSSLARILYAGFAMGIGICLMHYVGMAALRSAVSLGYDPGLVAASLIIAVGASTAALFGARMEHGLSQRAAASAILGLAIVGMHYTGMAALRLTPVSHLEVAAGGAPPILLAVAVGGGTLFILVLALIASLYDQRGNILSALDAGGVGYWELDLRHMALQVSAKGKQLLGVSAGEPLTFGGLAAKLAPEERARREQQLASALRTGEYDAEHALAGEARVLNFRGKVLKDSRGKPRRMIGVLLDVTDRHTAFSAVTASERRQRVLINELNHRVKNSLATVQSIAAQTARRADDLADFREKFEARLVALSATHNALTTGGWEGASIRTLLCNELSPYDDAQVRLDGEDVALSPAVALSLGLVFHELATNAAKYGALSAEQGCVHVTWQVDGAAKGRRLSLTWRERGGPMVATPSRRGFGSRLIESSIGGDLGGATHLKFEPEGLEASITVPVSSTDRAAIPLEF